MSMSGSKIKPEDLFESLKVLKEETSRDIDNSNKIGQKFFTRFKDRMTEEIPFYAKS